MNIKEAKTTIRIKNLRTLKVEIPKEPSAQRERIFHLHEMDIPEIIDDLLELNEYRKKERMRNVGHQRITRTQQVRTIPD